MMEVKSVYLIFELTMPKVGSWNGKWTGEKDYHAKAINFTQKYGASQAANDKLKNIEKDYYYNFGDGWGASVSVKQANSKEAAKANRKSKGFCGYDWMIDSILRFEDILSVKQIADLNNA